MGGRKRIEIAAILNRAFRPRRTDKPGRVPAG
jgi:hypothetical protein